MTNLDVMVGPLDLKQIAREFGSVPATRPALVDMPQSIHLARMAQSSGGFLESDVSVCWFRDASLLGYASLCLRRGPDGSLALNGMPNPLRLPALLPDLDERTRRSIVDSFLEHLADVLARTESPTAHVWVRSAGDLSRASLEARWLSAVPTVGAGVSLDVELAASAEHSWSGLRRRYRSLINRGDREFSTSIAACGSTSAEVSESVDELARLHAAAAGRPVYDSRLWNLAKDLVRAGSAACVLVRGDSEAVGALLLLLDCPRSSYAVGAFDRSLMARGLPIGHTALWSAMRWLGQQQFTRLSLGTAPTPPPSEGKEAGIDQFKRGFATVLSPWMVTAVQAAH